MLRRFVPECKLKRTGKQQLDISVSYVSSSLPRFISSCKTKLINVTNQVVVV